jgi:hypothetical protein
MYWFSSAVIVTSRLWQFWDFRVQWQEISRWMLSLAVWRLAFWILKKSVVVVFV